MSSIPTANMPAALKDHMLDAICSPDIDGNLQTAAPLSEVTGPVVTVMAKAGAGTTILQAHPTGTVIWIGDKGDLSPIWTELGAPRKAPQACGEVGVIALQSLGRRQAPRLAVPAGGQRDGRPQIVAHLNQTEYGKAAVGDGHDAFIQHVMS